MIVSRKLDYEHKLCYIEMIDWLHRVVSGAPITPFELRFAGLFALTWFFMDVFWFVSTLNHWFGL